MNQQDLNQIAARGISEQQIEHQLEQIKNGFPFLKLEEWETILNLFQLVFNLLLGDAAGSDLV